MEDPKKLLTHFLTRLEAGQNPDMSTDFPTMDAVRLQGYYRLLGKEFGLKFFSTIADRLAAMMWSLGRKSRGEAVESIKGLEKGPQIRRRMFVEEEGEKAEK